MGLVAVRRKVNAMACIGTAYLLRRRLPNGECFESFCGNVQSSGYHEQPRSKVMREQINEQAGDITDELR
jgi:hypothetical protein